MTKQPNRTLSKDDLFFCSWSGGKDSCLALHRACKAGAKPAFLLTMFEENGLRTKAHGLRKNVVSAQAKALGIPLISGCAAWEGYEVAYIAVLNEIRKKEVNVAVFGDIDFMPHLEWDEKVCAKVDMTPCLPLWQDDRAALLHEFISLGYKALIVRVDERKLSAKFLGRIIDGEVVGEFRKIGIDPCGENGEYHTVVVDGPLFSGPLSVETCSSPEIECPGYRSLDVRLGHG